MTPQLDNDRLGRFYEEMGRDATFVAELVGMYRARAEAFLAAAERGHANDGLADLAHQLAGASGPFGMTDITHAALGLESQLRNGEPHFEDLEVIVRTLPELMAELERWAQGLAS